MKYLDRQFYKGTLQDNSNTNQELTRSSDYGDYYYLHLVESAPFNLGKNKLYEAVPGNIFAFSCKLSVDYGYHGFISFTFKTKLIEHYKENIIVTPIGRSKKVIFPNEAIKLIRKSLPI